MPTEVIDYSYCIKMLQFIRDHDDNGLDTFLADNKLNGFVRESCIPASVYKQEPNWPANFPPNNEKLTPLQWLAIIVNEMGENDAIEYFMLDITQDYGADGKGNGDYKKCFFEGPIQEENGIGLDYSPVVLACIFNNSSFLRYVWKSCDRDDSLFDSEYHPMKANRQKYKCDVREYMPLQIASLLGSYKVIDLINDLDISVTSKPADEDWNTYGSRWRELYPITLSIVGFALPLEDFDPVSRAAKPTRTSEDYYELITTLLDHDSPINTPNTNAIKWSAMYELIHNAFGREYTKGSEQDKFNKHVLELFLPSTFEVQKMGPTPGSTITTTDELDWKISAPQVLEGLDAKSNLSTRKKNPSPISKNEKIRRRMFIYDQMVKAQRVFRPKIDEINLKKLIIKNVEETFPEMMEDLIATGKYHTRATIAMSRLNREKENVERLKGSEKLDQATLKQIKGYIARNGGRRKTKKVKKSRNTKKKGRKSKKKPKRTMRRR